jgi:hypothetical protein
MTAVQIYCPNWLDFIFALPVLCYRKLKYGYSFRRIPLGEGRYTIVDQQDFYWLNHFHWTCDGKKDSIYAVRNIISDGERKIIRMHREIMKPPAGLLVDHRNNKTWDNRRDNLRVATSSQNLANRRIDKSKDSSRFRGVCYRKERGRWSAQITFMGKAIRLGYYGNEIDAAKAYDEAAKKYHGEFAKLNFPKEIERSPKRLNLRLANWLGARLNFPQEDYANKIISSNQSSDKFVKIMNDIFGYVHNALLLLWLRKVISISKKCFRDLTI